MNIKDVNDKIKNIENEIGAMVEQKLKFSDASMEQVVIVAIVNDSIDLIEDIQRNIYAFNLSYENYNNAVSFNPNYYFENIILQDDMIWERIIFLVGVLDQLNVNIIFEQKSVEPLYDMIKKKHSTDDDIIVDLRCIRGDYNSKRIKWKRNNNEHFVSTHLDTKETENDIGELIFINNDQIKMNMEKCFQLTDRNNEIAMKELKEWIQPIERKQGIYIRLMKKIINEFSIKNRRCSFNCTERLSCETEVLNKNIVNDVAKLEKRYETLREEYRNVINQINEWCIDMGDEASNIRNTLLIDAIFRAKEIARSLNLYFCCLNYDMDKKILFAFSKEYFIKFLYNEVITPNIYCFHAIMKTYSVCEKIAKFILCKYDFEHEYITSEKFKNMYIEDIIAKINEKQITSDIIEKFMEIMEGKVYSHYEKIRNLEYHCLRQEYLNCQSALEINLGKVYEVFVLLNQLFELLELLVGEEKVILSKRIKKREIDL